MTPNQTDLAEVIVEHVPEPSPSPITSELTLSLSTEMLQQVKMNNLAKKVRRLSVDMKPGRPHSNLSMIFSESMTKTTNRIIWKSDNKVKSHGDQGQNMEDGNNNAFNNDPEAQRVRMRHELIRELSGAAVQRVQRRRNNAQVQQVAELPQRLTITEAYLRWGIIVHCENKLAR